MPDAFSRPLSAIDADIRGIQTLNRDAEQQLEYLRRQQAELNLLEYNLLCAIEGRAAKTDRLLDERLRSQQTQPETVTA